MTLILMQIGHSIGQGSFAMVYKGKERMTGREVAMKIVRAQDQIEFDDGSGGCPDDAYRLNLIMITLACHENRRAFHSPI